MTKTKSIKTLILSVLLLAIMLCGFAKFGAVAASAAEAEPFEADVAYIKMENDQRLTINPTGYVLGDDDEIAHTGEYVIFGNANTNISFEGNDENQTAYDVTFHNLSAVSQAWHGCVGIERGVTLNMTVVGINKFIGYNHPGISAGYGNETLDTIINLTVAENSSVEFNASYNGQNIRGMDDGITLNVLSGDCSVDMTTENWNHSGFTVSNGTPAEHTNHSYASTEDICKILCSDCGMMLLNSPHKHNIGAYKDTSTHMDVCKICGYEANIEAHTYENVLFDEMYCEPKCTVCGYVNSDGKEAHSFANGACEHCSTPQAIKTQNGNETKLFVTWEAAAKYVNENDNCTLTLLCNTAMASEVQISKNLTIDLAGYTLSNCYIAANGEIQLMVIDSNENKTGEVIADSLYAFVASNGSKVVIDGIRLSGGVSADANGSIAVNGITATSNETRLHIVSGSISVDGGDFKKLCVFFDYNYTEGSPVSVKNITCTGYIISAWDHKTIADTLADGYTLVFADDSYVDVTLSNVRGEMKTVAHTHDYTFLDYDDANHWGACKTCRNIDPNGTTEAHTGGTATCAAKAICQGCGNEYGNILSHTGGTATCTAKAVCEACGNGYGSILPHSWSEDNICTVCQSTPLIEVTADGVTKTYTSMSEAFNELDENNVENAVVRLLGNVAFKADTSYINSGSIVLDLNGYMLSGCGIIIGDADVTVKDTSEQGSGAFSGLFCLTGFCTLTVESGYIDAEIYLDPDANPGTPSVVITGGSFSEKFGIVSAGGSITVSGGEFVYGSFAIREESGMATQLEIIGGKFANGLIIDSQSGSVVLSDIITDAACTKYLDADGNEMSVDKSGTTYSGYIEIVHNGEYEASGDEYGHRFVCTSCGYALELEEHIWANATCDTPKKCSVCDVTMGEALGHSWNEGTVTTQPTCTATGVKTFTCQNDNSHAYAAEVDALGHAEETLNGKAATCTEAGSTDGVKCSVCDEILTAQTEIAATGHTEETVNGKAATCTEAGLTDGVKCSVCDEILTAQTEIAATGHAYDNDCDTTCNTCGEERTPAEHIDADENNACDECGAELPKDGLSGGAIAGIVVGSVLVVGLGGFAIFWFVIKKKKWADLIGIFKK